MKILLIGANGTIGKAVGAELSQRHEVITAGRNSGDYRVNIQDVQSIRDLYAKTGTIDAVACAAGNVTFAPLESMTPEQFDVGIRDKLMGQVHLVLIGREYVSVRGSFTLISGSLADEPVLFGSSASMVNAAINAFVRAAAIELPNVRINAVSPTVLEESMESYGPFFRGAEAVPARRVALAYSRSIEGANTGQVYNVL
jgi:NAD(P)-dependent dehydrogenase (short-subunit alcohol dehydrogenase family)